MPNTRKNKTVRLTAEEDKEFKELMREHGFTQFSPFVRFAVKQLGRQSR